MFQANRLANTGHGKRPSPYQPVHQLIECQHLAVDRIQQRQSRRNELFALSRDRHGAQQIQLRVSALRPARAQPESRSIAGNAVPGYRAMDHLGDGGKGPHACAVARIVLLDNDETVHQNLVVAAAEGDARHRLIGIQRPLTECALKHAATIELRLQWRIVPEGRGLASQDIDPRLGRRDSLRTR